METPRWTIKARKIAVFPVASPICAEGAMLLERTISQLDIGPLPPDRAVELGHLGFLQWLGGLPGSANYREAARHAVRVASPFCATSPAVGVFCDLLKASDTIPPAPLDLILPTHHRRGGAQARREAF